MSLVRDSHLLCMCVQGTMAGWWCGILLVWLLMFWLLLYVWGRVCVCFVMAHTFVWPSLLQMYVLVEIICHACNIHCPSVCWGFHQLSLKLLVYPCTYTGCVSIQSDCCYVYTLNVPSLTLLQDFVACILRWPLFGNHWGKIRKLMHTCHQ